MSQKLESSNEQKYVNPYIDVLLMMMDLSRLCDAKPYTCKILKNKRKGREPWKFVNSEIVQSWIARVRIFSKMGRTFLSMTSVAHKKECNLITS